LAAVNCKGGHKGGGRGYLNNLGRKFLSKLVKWGQREKVPRSRPCGKQRKRLPTTREKAPPEKLSCTTGGKKMKKGKNVTDQSIR